MADPIRETTPPVADFGRQGDPSAVIPSEAFLGGWNVQVRAIEAEVVRLREVLTSIEGVTMSMCFDHADMAERMRGKAREALAE